MGRGYYVHTAGHCRCSMETAARQLGYMGLVGTRCAAMCSQSSQYALVHSLCARIRSSDLCVGCHWMVLECGVVEWDDTTNAERSMHALRCWGGGAAVDRLQGKVASR